MADCFRFILQKFQHSSSERFSFRDDSNGLRSGEGLLTRLLLLQCYPEVFADAFPLPFPVFAIAEIIRPEFSFRVFASFDTDVAIPPTFVSDEPVQRNLAHWFSLSGRYRGVGRNAHFRFGRVVWRVVNSRCTPIGSIYEEKLAGAEGFEP